MRSYLISMLILLLTIGFGCNSSSNNVPPSAEKVPTAGYDSTLAARLQADPYGMRQYVMAFLKKGPNRDRDSLEAARLQMAHLENIGRLAKAGKLSLAGPFMDAGDIRGIYIFNVTDTTEARRLTETDPAIQAGSLVMELRPWYGSAALQEVNELHKRLQKQGLTDESGSQ